MLNRRRFRFISLLTLAVILILFTVTQVSGFMYYVTTLNNTITKQESAEFKLIISNTAGYDDYFTISTRDVNWVVASSPASGMVLAGEDVEFLVKLRPKPLVAEGRTYFIPVKVKSETTGFHYEEIAKFAVYVVSPFLKPGVYTPTVVANVYVDNTIDPREKLSVRLNLKNKNSRDLEGLKVVLNGEIFFKEYITHLLPLEEKLNEILFEVDSISEPGSKTVTVTLFFDDKKISESSAEYYVQSYTDMKETPARTTFLFRTKGTYSIYNDGNVKSVAEKKFRINFLKRLFTKFSPDVVRETGDDGKTYYVVRQELDPEERLDVVMITDYRLVALVILLIILCVILYFALRSPIVLIKSAEPLGKTKDGVSEIKIRIYMKNRSRKSVSNLRIVDSVPRIAEVEKKIRLGSMEPTNVGKGRRGTVVRWELDVLEPYEERIITYRIRSQLRLIGGIRLPSAKVRYDGKGGKDKVTYSSAVNLVSR